MESLFYEMSTISGPMEPFWQNAQNKSSSFLNKMFSLTKIMDKLDIGQLLFVET